MNESEAGVDLVVIETSLLFLGPIYTVRFLSHATTAYDRPTTRFTIVVYVTKNVVAFLKTCFTTLRQS